MLQRSFARGSFCFVPLILVACAASEHAPAPPPSSAALAIVGITVVHPRESGDAVEDRDCTVLVEGDRILAVGPSRSTPIPAGARQIDGHGKWIIPGLIDSHVHFFQSGNPFARPDAADFTDTVPYAAEVARNKARLDATFKVWLASGTTSVVDAGGPMWNFEMRDRARSSDSAPRVLVAGPLVSLISNPKLDLDDPPIIQVSSPDEARALVAGQLAKKPDFIKVWFIHVPGGDLDDEQAICAAAAEEAHKAGVRLLVHATELDVAKAALRAGADILVHSVFDRPVDDEFLALALECRAIYVPTLFVDRGYGLELSGQWEATDAERRLADPQVLASMKDLPKANPQMSAIVTPPAAMESLPRIWAAGIPVALGTDAGNIGTLHGPGIFREMELMAKSGLSPAQVLVSATVNGAKVLGMQADLGDVAAGKLADLTLLDADPLVSVANVAKIHLVVRAGRVFDPEQLIASIR